MKIEAVRMRPTRIEIVIDESRHTSWSIPRHDLWVVGVTLEHILVEHDVLAHIPGKPPVFQPGWREHLQLSSITIEPVVEWAGEVRERNAAGLHTAGGLWMAEIEINGTITECNFDTLEDLYQLVFQIICREASTMIGIPRGTIPGLVGHA